MKMKANKSINILNEVSPDELMANILLYKYPLYKYYGDDGNIHILFLGSGTFVNSMLLASISMGQMINHKLFIHVVSRDVDEFKSKLLLQAPMLNDYADLGDNEIPEENKYVFFSFEKVTNLANERTCSRIAKKYSFCRYIVISIGDSENNTLLAKSFADSISKYSLTGTVLHYYVPDMLSSKTVPDAPTDNNVKLVPFNISNDEYEREKYILGMQAFRVNYLYEKQFNPRASKEQCMKVFCSDQYAQRSSLAAAVHLDYKIASLDINIPDVRISHRSLKEHQAKVIEKYSECLNDDQKFNSLVEVEHRRWMMAQIAEGYCTPTISDFEQYAFKKVNGKFNRAFKCTDPEFKLHHCIVPSSVYTKRLPKNRDEWDKYQSVDEIYATEYDELDKMSLVVHLYAKQKVERRATRNRIKQIINDLEELLVCSPEDNDIRIKFETFSNFINEIILHKTTSQLKERILAIKYEFEVRGLWASDLLQQLDDELSIFTEFSSYKDYKSSDETIIKNLLWIKYSENVCVIKETTSHIASDITVPLIIEPEVLVFVGSTPSEQIVSFFKNHGNNSKVYFESCHIDEVEKLIRKLKSITDKYKNFNVVIDITSATSLFAAAAIMLAKNNSHLGIVSCRASDSKLMNIVNFPQYSMYNLNTHISSKECFELHGAKSKSEYRNYMLHLSPYIDKLWLFYQQHKNEWEMISSFFSIFGRYNSVVYVKNIFIREPNKWSHYTRSLPSSAIFSTGITKVMKVLEQAKIVKDISLAENDVYSILSFDYQASSNTDFLIKQMNSMFDHIGNKKLICRVFNKPDGNMEVEISSDIWVSFKSKNDYVDKETKKSYELTNMFAILQELEQLNLINSLKTEILAGNEIRIQFLYASSSIKECLATAGNILEAKVWFCAEKTGYFDTIQSNFSFEWSNESVSNELDIVLTKDLKTIICSCKTAKYCKEHLYEIESLARKFSVNSIPVIIYSSDKSFENGKITSSTQAVVERAKEMGVHLIDEKTINNGLGEELIRIAEI